MFLAEARKGHAACKRFLVVARKWHAACKCFLLRIGKGMQSVNVFG